MEFKMTPQGSGVYYFALSGAKGHAIFHSVFEYEYATSLLASIPSTRLLAYVFDSHVVHCVLRCERDWQEVLGDIHHAFETLHERCWNKRRPVLSEQATVLLVDEYAYLTDLILQLHDWPRYTQRVADAALWPYSSDKYYRALHPTSWLDTDSMLNLLVHSRRNRAQHYEAIMQRPIGNKLDLQNGTDDEYAVLARPQWLAKRIEPQEFQSAPVRNSTRLYQDACQLVASHFGLSVDELTDALNRRRFHHLMPLVAWLLLESDVALGDISAQIGEDEERITLWLRNVHADHTDNVRSGLLQRWQPSNVA